MRPLRAAAVVAGLVSVIVACQDQAIQRPINEELKLYAVNADIGPFNGATCLVAIDIPRAGTSYSFRRPLVVDEESLLTFKYKAK